MLEIAGGVVLGGAVLFILWVFFYEIVKVVGHLALWWMAVMLLVACLLLLGAAGTWVWQLLVTVLGHQLAAGIVEPILLVAMLGGPVFLWIDAKDGFEMTRASFSWVRRRCKPSTGKVPSVKH